MTHRWLRAGDSGLLLRFEGEVGTETQARVWHAFDRARDWGNPAVTNLHPAYRSLLVEFDPRHTSFEALRDALEARLHSGRTDGGRRGRLVEVPVHYDGEDLESVAAAKGLTTDEVVRLHCGAEYAVSFVGFQPGFPYLAGLPGELEMPRLSTPRLKVPAGSVAIAGKQAGIYPFESPGGWRLLGSTPIVLFDEKASPPVPLAMGDRVRFVPIAKDELERLRREAR